MEKQLIEGISDGVATLTFNRPDRLNALSTPIMEGLLEALPRLARRRRSDRAGLVGARVAQGLYDVLAERHARQGRAQTLQDARKPMHT
jgi:enoyl-CoA hydratase/carnithine racemase